MLRRLQRARRVIGAAGPQLAAQPLPPRGLVLRVRALRMIGRAGEAYGLLGALRQQNALPPAELAQLEVELAAQALQEAADATGCDRVGLLGFCMGGMYCFKAARSDRFAKIASFYGMIRLPDAWKGPGQGEPLDHLAAGHPDRVLAIIGGLDPYTPPDDVVTLEAAGVNVVQYPDAEHGFAHAPERPAHRPDDAADAFQRAHTWLTT